MRIKDLDITSPDERTGLIKDAHIYIREIKSALKDTFPHFSKPMNILFSDINNTTKNISINATSNKMVLHGTPYLFKNTSQKLMVDRNGMIKLSNPLPPIGTVIKTTMVMSQLNTIYGVGVFEHFDPSISVLSTPYNSMTIEDPATTMPGLYSPAVSGQIKKSYFLRQTDQDSNIGTLNAATVGEPVGGLPKDPTLGITITSKHSHIHTFGHTHGINNTTNQVHSMAFSNENGPWLRATYYAANTTANTKNTVSDASHNHIFNLTADEETRPKNITLNHYLRIR